MALILPSMPQVQREQIVLTAAQRLNRITRSGVIAGGYARDAVLGGRVKDIDIFVDSSRYPTDERRDALCDRIYEAFGQTWQRTSMDSAQAQATYGADPETGETFETYNSLSTEGEWNRVNVIFSRQNQKLNQFDWSICRFYVDPESVNPIYTMRPQDRDLRNILFTGGIADLRNTAGIIEHANRIKAKYESARFMFDPNSFANLGMLYSQMIQGGLIGSQAREVLPTQTEMPFRDEVGLNTGARSGVNPRTGSGWGDTAAAEERRQRWVRIARDLADQQQLRTASEIRFQNFEDRTEQVRAQRVDTRLTAEAIARAREQLEAWHTARTQAINSGFDHSPFR